jgi:hypothetical protein
MFWAASIALADVAAAASTALATVVSLACLAGGVTGKETSIKCHKVFL